jgi:hypothetical protein
MGRFLSLLDTAIKNTRDCDKSDKSDQSPPATGLRSLKSLRSHPETLEHCEKAASVRRLVTGAAPDVAAPEPERARWGAADWRAFYDERAAIREYDGQRPRPEAERLAWGETLGEWHKANGSPPPSWQCAGCGEPIGGAPAMTLPDAARVHDVAGYGCLIAYGKRWRATAAKALAEMGVTPP